MTAIINHSNLKKVRKKVTFDFDYNHSQLVHITREPQLAKNFHDEVHAAKDVQIFLDEAQILIENENNCATISDILKKLLVLIKNADTEMTHKSIESIKTAIFRHRDAGNNALLAESFQGYFVENDKEIFDQEWIIAMATTEDLISTKIGFCKTDTPISRVGAPGAHAPVGAKMCTKVRLRRSHFQNFGAKTHEISNQSGFCFGIDFICFFFLCSRHNFLKKFHDFDNFHLLKTSKQKFGRFFVKMWILRA